MSLKEEPESDSKRKRSESPEFTSTKHEHTDLSEESSDHEHKNKRAKSERAHSPAPSYMSLSSDWSIEPPTNFKSRETFHLDLSESKKRICELPTMKEDHVEITHLSDEHKNISVKSERAASPAPSYMSLRTDWSMEPPTNLKTIILDTSIKEEKETITISTNNQMDNMLMIRVSERAPSPTLSLWSDFSVEPPAIGKAEDTFPLDSRLLTSHHLKCPVCKSLLKDPVSILCGHNFCRGCINEFWDNCAGDYVCPQCGNPSETRPVLNTNAALAAVVKNLQQAAFSPALPPQSYAGPEDVACDFCTEQRLKAVKCCLTCVMSLCETHVRQHYTIPALQKHTLSDVPGDMKTKPSQEHQNTDNSFSSTVSEQQDQTDKTQDVIEGEVRSISESTLNICMSEMAVNKDTDVRSLALLQQEDSGLKKSLSNLKEKKTKKEKYFDEDYGEENDEEEDDDDDDDDDDHDYDYDYDDEDYNEKDSDSETDEEEKGDEDYSDDAEGYTDDEEEKEDSYDDEKDNIDDYNEDYDDEDYNYSEDDKDEEDNEDDEDEDCYDEDY